MHSQTYLSRKLTHWLAKIQEKHPSIIITKAIKEQDLELHLAQYLERCELKNDDESLSVMFLINEQKIDVADHP